MDLKYTSNYWKDYFDRVDVPMYGSSFARFCLSYMRPDDIVLDVCCGNGRDSEFFNDTNIDTHAFDICTRTFVSRNLREWGVSKKKKKIKFTELNLEDGKHNFLLPDSFMNFVYCRFVLHAIPEILEDYILINSNRVLKDDGLFFIEARSDKGSLSDELDPHYRRLINIDVLEEKLTNLNFEIIFKEESDGLSVYETDNPVLIRIVARKNGAIKVNSEKSFDEFHAEAGCINPVSSRHLLLKTKHILDNNNITFLLIFGTLLGAYRDKSFIEHDGDIDIGFFSGESEKVRELINEGYFAVYGIEFIRCLHSDTLTLFSLKYDNDYIDFGFFREGIISQYKYGNVPVNDGKEENGYFLGGHTIKKSQISDGLTEIEFLDTTFMTFNNIELYLTRLYGDWRIPDKSYHAKH